MEPQREEKLRFHLGDHTGRLDGSHWIRPVETDEHIAAEAGERVGDTGLSPLPHPLEHLPGGPGLGGTEAVWVGQWRGSWEVGEEEEEEETLLRRWEAGGMGWGPREGFVKRQDLGQVCVLMGKDQ